MFIPNVALVPTSRDDEPIGHVDDGVKLGVLPDVILDASAEVLEQAVDPLGQACDNNGGTLSVHYYLVY